MKNIILNIAIGIIIINGLGELAISQVHILAITKLFANEIGMYLFLFTIFGLTTTFNAFSLKTRRSIIFYIVTSWLAAVFGYIYLNLMQADVAAQETLSMVDVQTSWRLMIVSIAIYLVGSIVIPLLSWGNVKTSEI
ncbi:MAG: hypothetical protein DWQ04_17400 [Chloroflexi bacterium]|nr:MAG: hypothetical protein DWQ04_17400 [Chloroflexota bacterium]